jgi:hypothetical protein
MTPHPGVLDEQVTLTNTAIIHQQMNMFCRAQQICLEKNLDSATAYCEHLFTEMGPTVVKKGLEIKAAITMAPTDRLALKFL